MRPTLFPPRDGEEDDHHRRATDGEIEWRKAIPRWGLLMALAVLLVASGWLFSRLDQSTAREQARIEQALADAPTKYQARLSERLAVVESQTTALSASIAQLAAQIDQQSRATNALTVELRVLNSEIKTQRR